MSAQQKAGWFMLVAGIALLAYGVWAWRSRAVLSTWLRTEYPSGLPYWLTVGTLIGLGAANIGFGIYMLIRRSGN